MSKWTTLPEFGSRRFKNDPTATYIQRKYKMNGYIGARGMGEFGAAREIALRESCAFHDRPWSDTTKVTCSCDHRTANLLDDDEVAEMLNKIEEDLGKVMGEMDGRPVTLGEVLDYYDNYGRPYKT